LSETTKAYLYIHIAVILFGFTAILGDLITLTALVLVWWRVMITSGSLLFFFKQSSLTEMVTKGVLLKIAGVGVIVSLHWLCFYGAVKVANATVALVAMSATSVFTSVMEPLLNRQPFRKKDIIPGLLMIPCFVLITQYVPGGYYTGLVIGLLAAALAALFSILNKNLSKGINVYAFTFVELFSASLFLTLIIIANHYFSFFEVKTYIPTDLVQWGYIFILALFCTTLAYVLSLKALQHISAFASNIVINLEPVYGILLAVVLLGKKEYMHPGFYVGAFFIVVIVLMYPFLTKRYP
jgi:drug/metabolite transporter (DMT)-like permease